MFAVPAEVSCGTRGACNPRFAVPAVPANGEDACNPRFAMPAVPARTEKMPVAHNRSKVSITLSKLVVNTKCKMSVKMKSKKSKSTSSSVKV